jgi:hypothetical protein
MLKGMRFVATHNVTVDDVVRAAQLGVRRVDLLLSIFVVVVLIGILSQVFYSFTLYVVAVVNSPAQLIELLRFESGGIGIAMLSWLSIIVALSLPVFLFYALRSLAETLFPAWRVRRLTKNSDMIGPTTYIVDNDGVRSIKQGGADVFLPWTALDAVRCDAEVAVLMRSTQVMFFVPLAAFGDQREAVLAQIRSCISVSGGSQTQRS